MKGTNWAPQREEYEPEYDSECRRPARELADGADYGGGPAESKRDKRRRDMVDRVGRLLNDTVERRDRSVKFLLEPPRLAAPVVSAPC